MRLAALFLIGGSLWAQDSTTGLRASQSALLGATLVDALSSRGGIELNPIMGRGDFTMHNQGSKAMGFTAGFVVVQTLMVRRWPSSARVLKYTNWFVAGSHGAAAIHNWRQ